MSTYNNGVDKASKPVSPSQPSSSRHQIKRSLSELASPGKLNRRQHRRQESQYEDKEKPPLSAAIRATQARRSLDLPLSTGTTPLMSPSPIPSRRTSIMAPRENGPEDVKDKKGEAKALLLEQAKASIRADGLKQSLLDLNSFSTTMTKRLDDTYYSVLEKMSTLHNTVVALEDLAKTSHDMCESFDRDSRDLESDVIRQLSAAGQFEQQQRRISSLQKRIHQGRDKIAALASRVDVIQKTVERWERSDKCWQEKTRKRLKIIWTVTTALAVVFIAIVVGFSYAGVDGEAGLRWNSSMSPNIPPWLNASGGERSEGEEESGRRLLWKAPLRDDGQLRAFDEL